MQRPTSLTPTICYERQRSMYALCIRPYVSLSLHFHCTILPDHRLSDIFDFQCYIRFIPGSYLQQSFPLVPGTRSTMLEMPVSLGIPFCGVARPRLGPD